MALWRLSDLRAWRIQELQSLRAAMESNNRSGARTRRLTGFQEFVRRQIFYAASKWCVEPAGWRPDFDLAMLPVVFSTPLKFFLPRRPHSNPAQLFLQNRNRRGRNHGRCPERSCESHASFFSIKCRAHQSSGSRASVSRSNTFASASRFSLRKMVALRFRARRLSVLKRSEQFKSFQGGCPIACAYNQSPPARDNRLPSTRLVPDGFVEGVIRFIIASKVT